MIFMVTNRKLPHKKRKPLTYLYNMDDNEFFGGEGEAGFFLALEEALLLQKKRGVNSPLVGLYLHGYNTNFEESVAQLVDLQRSFVPLFTTPPILIGFSWPSAGRSFRYLTDRWKVRRSAGAFTQFINRFSSFLTAHKAQFSVTSFCIAHSLGSYFLKKGVLSVKETRGEIMAPFFDETLLLAPDLAATDLERGGKGEDITHFSQRVHIYYSPKDKTLKASSASRLGKRRLGRYGAHDYGNLPKNVLVIDASTYARDSAIAGYLNREGQQIWVHNSYRYHQGILRDMVRVLRQEELTGRVALWDADNHFSLA